MPKVRMVHRQQDLHLRFNLFASRLDGPTTATRRKRDASWDGMCFTKKVVIQWWWMVINGDLMIFNGDKWWFNGDKLWYMVINGDKWWLMVINGDYEWLVVVKCGKTRPGND